VDLARRLTRSCRGRVALALWSCVALAGCAGPIAGASITTTAPSGAPERIPVTLSIPDGPGPFPAVVILHDCSGLGPRSSGAPGRWARELVAHGYVALMPDSFTTRGHEAGVCTVAPARGQAGVGPDRRARDTYAALAYLQALPVVDGRRVGIMGGSHGGTSTLAAMAGPPSDGEPVARGGRAGFAAGVALYPRCATRGARGAVLTPAVYRPVAPVLILIGDRDDWTPAEDCRAMVEASRAAGYPVTIKIYPGAHHAFDSPHPVRFVPERINPSAPGGRGATTGGDPAAWADSIREVLAFFAQHLK
jgi:dienelactone hydrolase